MAWIFRIKYELFTTPLFITLFVLDLVLVGVTNAKELILAICIFLEIPACYIGTQVIRKNLYNLFRGKCEYED